MIEEKQTVPYLNALMCGFKIQREQPCRSVRGCHTTSPLKSVLFRRKVVWQPLIELYCCTWHILEPTSRAAKWGIICFPSLSGSLSNPLRLKTGKVGVEQNRNTVYVPFNYFAFGLKIEMINVSFPLIDHVGFGTNWRL